MKQFYLGQPVTCGALAGTVIKITDTHVRVKFTNDPRRLDGITFQRFAFTVTSRRDNNSVARLTTAPPPPKLPAPVYIAPDQLRDIARLLEEAADKAQLGATYAVGCLVDCEPGPLLEFRIKTPDA